MRGLPAQASDEIPIFKSVLTVAGGKKLRVFEWGSGASTIYYPKFLQANGCDFDWYAMDNSRKWYQRGLQKISRANLAGQVQLHCSEFPAFWELPGYSPDEPVPPESYTASADVAEYINFPNELGGRFDVIIVDGRFRRRCLLAAKDALDPKGIVILHDAERTHYHSSLSSYPYVRTITAGTLAGTRHRSSTTLCSLEEGSIANHV